MEHLLDFQITRAFQAKRKDGSVVGGTGEWGDWRLYNLYTNKTPDDQKFGFMWDEKKPTPREGLNVKHMEYEVEIKGEFTNYSVKKIELAEGTQPDTQPTSTPTSNPSASGQDPPADSPQASKEKGVCTSYATEIAVAIISSKINLEQTDLDAIVRKVAKAGLIMRDVLFNGTPTPSEKPPEAQGSTEPEGHIPLPKDEFYDASKPNDPKTDTIECEFVKPEDGKRRHTEPVMAIYCLTSCMETSRCSMAKGLRDKYPGHELSS